MFCKALTWGGMAAAPWAAYLWGVKTAEKEIRTHNARLAQSRGGVVPLYVFPESLPCHKVRAYLDFHGIPYSTTDVSYVSKKEILWSSDYKCLPIALVGGEQVNDSSVILRALAKKQGGWFDGYGERAMCTIDDEVVPALQAVQWSDASAAFANGGWKERYVLPLVQPYIKRKMSNKFDDSFDAARLVPALEKAFGLLPGGGTAADLALFGVLRQTYHLPSVKNAVDECNRREWFEQHAKRCEERRNYVIDAPQPPGRGKCPFASEHPPQASGEKRVSRCPFAKN
eukprot:Rhum_TRINITY_DN2815_c0_g2::Rhum_TRINITY_DN2815_c0_g2_i1::g.8496::m.8496/K05309/PTGES2; microsomal prostaglandin-E synthase 2